MEENINQGKENKRIHTISRKKENVNFYDVEEFPELKLLEENYLKIKEELESLIEKDKTLKPEEKFFQPWIEKTLYDETNPNGWDIAPLVIGGTEIEANCKKTPFLYSLVKQIPILVSISFSLLKPETRIAPHKGYEEYSEEILRYHLGLIIPKQGDLGLRVNSDTTIWKEGKSFIFDDYQTHEAWNFTNEDRYVLICDFTSTVIEEIDESNNTKKIINQTLDFQDKNYNNSIKTYIENIGK